MSHFKVENEKNFLDETSKSYKYMENAQSVNSCENNNL